MNSQYIFKLDRPQKIALARILSDLIEADFIVDAAEMSFFEHFINQVIKISTPMLVEAKKTDIAKAVSILKELDVDRRRKIVGILKDLALSDGTCVPLEAIQILALERALENDAYVYSIPSSDIGIDNMTVIYIENNADNEVSRQIEEHYSTISEVFGRAGFKFVYIPYVVKDYRNMDSEYLRKVIRYMIPSISAGRVEYICHKLQNMTTSLFCRDLLYKRNGIPVLDANPSLLIKINESALIYPYDRADSERTDYANFLRIELKRANLLDEIYSLTDSYLSMVNCTIPVQKNIATDKFVYYGFHRSLFDMIAYGHEQKEYKLVIDISSTNANIRFVSLDGTDDQIPVKLNPQETALYVMIIKKSLTGVGLDWRDEPPQSLKKELLEEYNSIYKRIGKGRTAHVYKDRIQVHNIKNRLLAHKGAVANIDLFVPVHVKDGIYSFYSIKASDKVIIKEK